MKNYSHHIILADDAAFIARFPEQMCKVAVLARSDRKIKSSSDWTPGTDAVEGFLT